MKWLHSSQHAAMRGATPVAAASAVRTAPVAVCGFVMRGWTAQHAPSTVGLDAKRIPNTEGGAP